MTAKGWEFDSWFQAQHGPRPSGTDTAVLRARVRHGERTLRQDQSLLMAVERWEDLRTTALYAWQIKDSEKQGVGERR